MTIIYAVDTTLFFGRTIGTTHQTRCHIQNAQEHLVSAHSIRVDFIDVTEAKRQIFLIHLVGESITCSDSLRHWCHSAMCHFLIQNTRILIFFYIFYIFGIWHIGASGMNCLLSCDSFKVYASILSHLEEGLDGDAFSITLHATRIFLVALLIIVFGVHAAQLVKEFSSILTQPIG